MEEISFSVLDVPSVLQEAALFSEGTSHRITISRWHDEMSYMAQHSEITHKLQSCVLLGFLPLSSSHVTHHVVWYSDTRCEWRKCYNFKDDKGCEEPFREWRKTSAKLKFPDYMSVELKKKKTDERDQRIEKEYIWIWSQSGYFSSCIKSVHDLIHDRYYRCRG